MEGGARASRVLTDILPMPRSEHRHYHGPHCQHQAQGQQGGEKHFGAPALSCGAGKGTELVPGREAWVPGCASRLGPTSFRSLLLIQPPSSPLERRLSRHGKGGDWAFSASQAWEIELNSGHHLGRRRRVESTTGPSCAQTKAVRAAPPVRGTQALLRGPHGPTSGPLLWEVLSHLLVSTDALFPPAASPVSTATLSTESLGF